MEVKINVPDEHLDAVLDAFGYQREIANPDQDPESPDPDLPEKVDNPQSPADFLADYFRKQCIANVVAREADARSQQLHVDITNEVASSFSA